jgi:hypothetical protein
MTAAAPPRRLCGGGSFVPENRALPLGKIFRPAL